MLCCLSPAIRVAIIMYGIPTFVCLLALMHLVNTSVAHALLPVLPAGKGFPPSAKPKISKAFHPGTSVQRTLCCSWIRKRCWEMLHLQPELAEYLTRSDYHCKSWQRKTDLNDIIRGAGERQPMRNRWGRSQQQALFPHRRQREIGGDVTTAHSHFQSGLFFNSCP